MRVVVDTNILVSFAIRPNQTFEAIFDHISEHGTMLVSDATVQELLSVLTRDKFQKYIGLSDAFDFVDWYIALSERVGIAEDVIACRDPKDDKFLSLAVNGHADCILAGDRDLLDMGHFRGIPIHKPAAFIEIFIRRTR